MALKGDAKFEEKLTRGLVNDMRNIWHIFTEKSTRKCQNWNFDKILLSKVENVWASNLQWIYVSWKWKVTQKLKRNWLVILKLTWTSQILNLALKKSKNWLLVTKVYIVWATKIRRSYRSWHWGVIQILKKGWPVVWKKTEIWQIFTRALESVKIGTLMGFFCPK